MRIAVISHAQVLAANQVRWRRLAAETEHEVHLVVPERWLSTWFGEAQSYGVPAVHDGRFHVHPMPATSDRNWMRYLFRSLDAGLARIRPDLIYVVHEENCLIHQQVRLYRALFARRAKVLFFTMRGLPVPLGKWHLRARWASVRAYVDGAICHYPGCADSLRAAGFDKPIFLQTQIGVDETGFRPDPDARAEMRARLGLDDRFVVGFCGRLTPDKGVDDLLAALPLEGRDWALLLVGDGPMRAEVEQWATAGGWTERVMLTGTVPHQEVAGYMRAMDCFVLGSKTRPYWIDTFPLVSVQAMCVGVPVIVSDSGALPWQVRPGTGLMYPEGNVAALAARLRDLAQDAAAAAALAERGRTWALHNFAVGAINAGFERIARSVVAGEVAHKADPDDLYVQYKAV